MSYSPAAVLPPGGAFDAPQQGTATHVIQQGGIIQAIWWAPEDNIGDLLKFRHIQLAISGPDILLIVGGTNQPGLLRIRIFILLP